LDHLAGFKRSSRNYFSRWPCHRLAEIANRAFNRSVSNVLRRFRAGGRVVAFLHAACVLRRCRREVKNISKYTKS
jgi:hypothetical protein